MLTAEIKQCIEKSVLCWLATVSPNLEPNVSPKEIFTVYGEDHIIIANIASPQSQKNIQTNQNVCVSFIDILVQKGFKINGAARIISKSDVEFEVLSQPLLQMTQGKFPFASIISIKIDDVKRIIAPGYMFYPETTEADQITSAKIQYSLNDFVKKTS